ncbi:MAG TPA: sorbosone dehydrogenase family protein [Allosphingosinicella sp.]|jgi:glucose/arabinose dehydrogenase|nr:sorbosone dehydrogenase family protein [Allosphingosinicella sp.]
MRIRRIVLIAAALAVLALILVVANRESATLPVSAGMGPRPVLPKPAGALLPTVNVAEATGWHGARPTPAAGLAVGPFAEGLEHPRWLHVLPNGDVLVAETNAPPRPAKTGLRARIEEMVMKKAGATGPSANRITLLRDSDGDGVAETRSVFLSGLNSPFGMALIGADFYVANTDAVLRFPYRTGETRILARGTKLTDLPAGPRNHHWTKTLVAGPDGAHLYASVGSNSNVAEHGMAEEVGRAAIWEIDRATGAKRLFATGLRNAVGLAVEPGTSRLWASVNERDELGSDLVPDYMTSVRRGGFYGWPYSYFGSHVDARVKPGRPDLVARAVVPDYALGPHTASLGLAFYPGGPLGARYSGGAFIGQHGSWNRRPASGYKVIFVPFAGGRPSGAPVDVLTGFLDRSGKALGRPAGVAVDRNGALLVADDVGNTIWRVTAAR